MNLENMNRHERSLLLYFETCAVDFNGRVDLRRLNDADVQIAECWNENGFIGFGRVCHKDHNSQGRHWVELTEDAWSLAHQERRARHKRNPRRYMKTAEKG